MADHFADRYWSTKFWSTRYFQGGEVDPNAMTATLSGWSSMTGDLTAATLDDILGNGIRFQRKRKKPVKFDIAADDDFILTKVVEYLERAA
jgi:hypothetical protein